MNTAETPSEMPKETLRCEYHIQVYGRFVAAVCLQGAFDLPLALKKRDYLVGSFYPDCISTMLEGFVAIVVSSAFRDFCEARGNEGNNVVSPGSTDESVEQRKPLHVATHQDDLRLESVIKFFGRDIEALSQNGGFTMPGALKTSIYTNEFQRLFKTLVIVPALTKLREFFNQRELSLDNEKRQHTKATFVDAQPWNFGSENLTNAMERDQPGKREAA